MRLEWEVENWRAAAAYLTGRDEPDLVARPTGRAFGALNCARPDLGLVVTDLVEGLPDDPRVPAPMRDHLLANALYGVHVANSPDLEGPDWTQRVMAIAALPEPSPT